MTTKLTSTEWTELQSLEQLISENLPRFLQVGSALLRIRDEKLYRTTHKSFGDYCDERWDLKRSRAYQLIDAASVSDNLSTMSGQLPQSEAQLRPLAGLAPEEQQAIWQLAVEKSPSGKPTADLIKALMGKPRRADGKAKSKSEQSRRTPQWLFDYLNGRFGPFVLDAYADETNALCDRYFDAETDACTQLWPDKTFCNPEFKHMWPPLEHAVKMDHEHNTRSIFLAPVGCSQDWYHKLAIRGTIYVPDMRISFDLPDGAPTDGADRDTIVIALGRDHQNPAWKFGAFRVAQLLIADHFKRLVVTHHPFGQPRPSGVGSRGRRR